MRCEGYRLWLRLSPNLEGSVTTFWGGLPIARNCGSSMDYPHQRPGAQQRPCAERRLDRFLEVLGSAERDALACLDLDSFASRGIAPHARRAFPHHQDAQTGDADALPTLEMLHDEPDGVAENGLGLLLGYLVLFGDGGGEMLQRDGGWSLCRRFCGHDCLSPFAWELAQQSGREGDNGRKYGDSG